MPPLLLGSSFFIGDRSRVSLSRRLLQMASSSAPLTMAWAPVVMKGDELLGTLGPVQTVADKHFFKVSVADPGIRQLLVGYRSRTTTKRLAKWPLPLTLRELTVAKCIVHASAEKQAEVPLFDSGEVDVAPTSAKRVRTKKKMDCDVVEIRCPPIEKMPTHDMWVLPMYAMKGRSSTALWVEASPANIQYLMSAFDQWSVAQEGAASAPVADAEDQAFSES